MISPGGHSFLGGGLFADMFRDATEMVRHHIEKNGPQWQEIIESPNFKTNFKVGGTALKMFQRAIMQNILNLNI